MIIRTKPWNVVEHLDSDDAIIAYLEAAFEDGDTSVIAAAIGDVARAKGMSDVAQDAGLSRESLYKSLSTGGNPAFGTVMKVLRVLGIELTVKPHMRDVA
ncbi:MAG: putative addiction module antidote protein [Rhizobiaceae bacterium]|nr:putative addiction module antidote protein [Rhizobiaceae bacterium]MCV0404795.1 putative addiction module antidote protein [Rhizobiaceae bacterium]